MILQCPSCNARFLVADALIPPLGRTVRCGACSFQWFVEPTRLETVETATPDMPAMSVDFATLAEQAATSPGDAIDVVEPGKLPVISSRFFAPRPYRLATYALAAGWLLVAAIAYFPRAENWPVASVFYRIAGVTDTSGLAFSDISMQRDMDGDKTQFTIAGAITNRGDSPRHVPAVRVQLKDKKGSVVWARQYPVQHTVMPGESYPFRISDVKTSFASSVAAIVLDLGNTFELTVR